MDAFPAEGQAAGMVQAVMIGASAGAVHALSGPDHVLGVGPLALGARQAPWRVGVRWGVGHGLGTLLLALPLMWLAGAVKLPWLHAAEAPLTGLVLLIGGLWSLRQGRQLNALGAPPSTQSRGVLLMGLVHGITGVGGLLLLLPLATPGAFERGVLFLLAFVVGSTLAMGLLAQGLATFGTRLSASALRHGQRAVCLVSAAWGAVQLALSAA